MPSVSNIVFRIALSDSNGVKSFRLNNKYFGTTLQAPIMQPQRELLLQILEYVRRQARHRVLIILITTTVVITIATIISLWPAQGRESLQRVGD
jgi:hypothetical protein